MAQLFKVDDLLKRLLSGGLSALVIKVATAGLGYAMFVVLARVMSEADYGRFAFGFTLAITLSAVGSLGLTTAVMRFWPEYEVKNRLDLGKGFIIWSALASLVCSSALAICVIAVAYGLGLMRPQDDYGYLVAAAALIPCFSLAEYVSSLLRARGSVIAALAPRDIVWRGGVAAVAALAFAAGLDIDGRMGLVITASLLAGVVIAQGAAVVRQFAPTLSGVAPARDLALWRRTALPMWGAGVLFAMVQQFDVVLIGLFVSPEHTGAYFAALKTASLLGLMLLAANIIAAPLYSKFYHGGDRETLVRLCRLFAIGISVPTLIGFAMLAVIGPWLLAFFDPAFVAAYPLLMILAAGFATAALCGPVTYMLQMSGHEGAYLKIMVLTYAVTVAAQCLLIPMFGLLGAAIPNALGMAAWNIWSLLKLRREIGVDPSLFSLLAGFGRAGAAAGSKDRGLERLSDA